MRDRASGVPLEILKHLPLKPESACYVVLSTYSSDINRGLSPHYLFLEKVNLELLDNKSPGHNKSVSIQNPSDGFLACLPDSQSCTCDCLRPPDFKRHRKLKTSQECRGFQGVKIIRIGLIKGFIVEPILAAKFSYILLVDIVGMQKKTGSSPGISNIRSLS